MQTAPVLVVFGAVAIFVALSVAPAAAQSTAAEPATYVAEQICGRCHVAADRTFGNTLHAKVFRDNPRNEVHVDQPAQDRVGQAWHGPCSKHV
jgi:hypothetical protein